MRRLAAGLLLAGSLALDTARSQSPAAPLDTAALDARIEEEFTRRRMVGLAVAVSIDGKTVFEKGYGVRALDSGGPVTPKTRFAVGSVTKQFTCAAALALADEGKLSFDEPVARYFPLLTRAGEITLADLGGHVSGYHDYYPLDFTDARMRLPRPADQIIEDYAGRPLDFDPRARFSYSNTGYMILGRVAERIDGRPLAAQLAARFFEPLGMSRSALLEVAPAGEDSATGYVQVVLGEPELAAGEAPEWLAGAAGLWLTVQDLLRWDEAFMAGRVLSAKGRAAMTEPRRLADRRSTGYGCGLGIYDRPDMLRFSHTGAVAGFSASNTMIPSHRAAIALLANSETSLDDLRNLIVDALPAPASSAPAVSGLPPDEAARRLLDQLKAGRLDPKSVTPELAEFFTPARLATARRTLKGAKIAGAHPSGERGGLEVTRIDLTIGKRKAFASMYRRPDGTVEQFLVWPD